MKRWREALTRHPSAEATTLAFALVALAGLLDASGLLGRADAAFYDLALRSWERRAPDDVVIIAIDERSLQSIGQWPWSRRVHAQLLDRLSSVEPKAIGWDIAFTEAERDPAADAALAAALARNGRAVLPVAPENAGPGQVLRESRPLPALEQAAAGLGHVDVELDADGVAREVFLHAGLGKARWPALALSMLETSGSRDWNLLPGQRPTFHSNSPVPTWTRDYALRPTFVGPPGSLHSLSYVDVLHRQDTLEALHDKFVLIGATAQGLARLLSTPMTQGRRQMSGVEFHANVLDSLRRHAWVVPLPPAWRATLLVLLAAIPPLLFVRLGPRATLACTVVALIAIGTLGVALVRLGWWFTPAPNLVVTALAYPLWSWRRLERTSAALREQHERNRATLQSIADAVITCDEAGRITYMNPSAEALSGWSEEEARGRSFQDVFTSAESAVGAERDGRISLPVRHEFIRHMRRRSGEVYAVSMNADQIRNGTQDAAWVIAMNDITERLASERRLQHQATHDALTGLPNRVLLSDRIQQAMLNAQRTGSPFALQFIDLDGFKRINDSLGHALGDELLRAVAARLSAGGRSSDTVARWGGDEFVLLLEDLRREESITQIPRKILERFQAPFVIDGHEIFMTASIGISVYPRDGDSADTLLQRADAAMYRVKQGGRNDFRFHADTTQQSSLAHLELERDLHHALERGEFVLHFQAQRRVRNGTVSGAECLIRWQHPTGGLLPPAPFIPIAEQSDLIHRIDEWVLYTACSTLRRWQLQDLPPVGLSVNLSARQFHRRGIVDSVQAVLNDTKVDPSLITLELTETVVMHDVEQTVETLRDLNRIGVKISVDDFGTGYSSLAYLKRFPLDEIKIDQSFVRDLCWDHDDAAIVQAVINLAHNLDIAVTAEGVETLDQLRYLCEHGCDHVQGYYCGRPVADGEFTGLLRQGDIGPFDGITDMPGLPVWPSEASPPPNAARHH